MVLWIPGAVLAVYRLGSGILEGRERVASLLQERLYEQIGIVKVVCFATPKWLWLFPCLRSYACSMIPVTVQKSCQASMGFVRFIYGWLRLQNVEAKRDFGGLCQRPVRVALKLRKFVDICLFSV